MKAFRFLVPSLVGGFVLLSVGACGSSDDGGGSSSGTDCKSFATTLCKRLAACAPAVISGTYKTEAQCAERLALSCDADLKAPGVSATISDLGKCIDAYSSTSCDSLFSNDPPAACEISGTRSDGEVCGADLQCKSQNCRVTTGECGTCGPRVAAGQNCDSSGDCNTGLTCAVGVCATPVAAGGQCTSTSQCTGSLVCKGSTCGKAGAAGEACNANQPCDPFSALFCDPGSSTCKTVQFVNAGDTCGFLGGTFVACQGGGKCVGDVSAGNGTCSAAVADGEACDNANGPPCLEPAECVNGNCQLPNPTSCG